MGNFEVENSEIKNILKKLGDVIGRAIPRGWGFTLFIFSEGKGGSMFYISNAQRPDMIKALREFIERQVS